MGGEESGRTRKSGKKLESGTDEYSQLIIFCTDHHDFSFLREYNRGYLTVKDQIWLRQAQINKDKFYFLLADCHSLLIELRCSLCSSPLKLPSDSITKRSMVDGVADIIIKAD